MAIRRAAFWWTIAAMLAAMAAVQFTTVRRESQTYDESRQLLSGYTYLISGQFTVGIEHPPLLKLLWAIPVWFLHPEPPLEGEARQAGHDFLYRNRVAADSMLMAGRCSAILISVALGWAIAFWAKRWFGKAVALLALMWYVLDPNFLANGRYMKNDVGAALTIFAACMGWGWYLQRPTRKGLWWCGVFLGLALATKHSAMMLWPAMLLLYAVRRWQERRGFDLAGCLRTMGTAALIAFAVIVAVYRFEVRPLGAWLNPAGISPALRRLAAIPIPAATYFVGIGELGVRQAGDALGEGYLMGEQSSNGWWYMGPVAFAVKTPLAEWALFLIALGVAAVRLRTVRLREVSFRWFVLALPPAVYFAVSLAAASTAGERHMLPLYPFLFLFMAALLASAPFPRWRWLTLGVTGLLLLGETAAIHPHYLAFFNALAGGPVGGRNYLVNSNLDWGQDVKNLKAYLDSRHIPEVCVSYFGMADLDYYGIVQRPLPIIPDDGADGVNCVVAVSVTNLAMHPDQFSALEQRQPDARIGYSIYVYDLRKGERPAR